MKASHNDHGSVGHWFVIGSAVLTSGILSLALPFAVLHIYDRVLRFEATQTLVALASVVCLIILLDAILRFSRQRMLDWVGVAYEHDAACALTTQILDMPSSELAKSSAGTHLARLNAIADVRSFMRARTMIFEAPIGLISLAVAAMISWQLAIIPIVAIVITSLVNFVQAGQLKTHIQDVVRSDVKRDSFVEELIERRHTVKSLALEPQMLRRYELLCDNAVGYKYENKKLVAAIRSSGEACSQLVISAVSLIGALFVIEGNLTLGQMAAVVLLCGRSIHPIFVALALLPQFQSAVVARHQIGLLPRSAKPKVYPLSKHYRGDIELTNVTIVDPYNNDTIVRNLSAKIGVGELCALSPPKNVDASILANILIGNHLPDKGRIVIDGKPVDEANLGFAKNHMLMVSDSDRLFDGTIWENITLYGTSEFDTYANEILNSLAIPYSIAQLPKGYEASANENTDISSDLIQRICIARALIRKPNLLILKQVENRLDQRGFEHLVETIKYLRSATTVLIISNRPSFVKICAKVISIGQDGTASVECQDRRRHTLQASSPLSLRADSADLKRPAHA